MEWSEMLSVLVSLKRDVLIKKETIIWSVNILYDNIFM